jgi:hypothetical protein
MSWLDQHTEQDSGPSRRGTRWSLNFRDGQLALIGAIFGGLCTLGSTLISGVLGGPHISTGSGAQPKPTVTIIRTVTARPSVGASSFAPPPPSPIPTPTPSLLRPIISQPGWALAWYRKVSIGPEGIRIGISGPQTGDGSNYDLQYAPGGDKGWGYDGYVDAFNSWPYTYSPGPARIDGISGTSTGSNVVGTQANVGDRLYITLATQGLSVDRIAYMQVVGSSPGNIVADMWVWNAS